MWYVWLIYVHMNIICAQGFLPYYLTVYHFVHPFL